MEEKVGLLQLLLVPIGLWISIFMDFISGFQKVNKLTYILVVVEKFSKYVVFIATLSSCPSKVAVKLFYKNLVKNFKIPIDIVSNRNKRFTGRFWSSLFNMIGTNLKFSTTNLL